MDVFYAESIREDQEEHRGSLRVSNVAFLLALAGLPVACGDDDDGATGGEGGTSGAASESAGTQGGTTSTSDGTSDADDDATTDVGDADVCEGYAASYVECYPRYASYGGDLEAYCESAITYGTMTDGAACGAAIEDFFACLSELDCEDDHADCHAEDQAAEAACPNSW